MRYGIYAGTPTWKKGLFLLVLFSVITALAGAGTKIPVQTIEDNTGALIVAGSFDESLSVNGQWVEEAQGQSGVFVAKLASNGSIQWSKIFSEPVEASLDLKVTDENGIILRSIVTSDSLEEYTIYWIDSSGGVSSIIRGSIPIGT